MEFKPTPPIQGIENVPKTELEESVDKKLESLDRLIDWNTSLTDKESFRELLLSGKQLRIKFGADITAQTLHLGHAVNLRAMRTLQDLGHKVVFLLGGFTTLVGDPTGKIIARNIPNNEEIEKNKKAFIDQIKSVIKFDDPELIEIRDNTEWWGTPEQHGSVTVGNLFELMKRLTVSQMLSRDMFKKRQEEEKPIYLSEFLYPLLQGYDSVEMESDLTIVGSDQMFNEKMAWMFQEDAGQKKQAILCTKITPGIDGGEKQSKSIGNYVGLAFTPKEKFNKTMLLLDELVPEWFSVYTEVDHSEIEKFRQEYENDPISFKKKLAYYIVEQFHGTEDAEAAEKDFEERKILSKIPTEIPEKKIPSGETLDYLLRNIFRQKTGNIKDLAANEALAIITKINEDGSFEERMVQNISEIKDIKLQAGDIIRWGKNKFYRIGVE